MAVQLNRYLTFLLGDEIYGLSIIKVKEIIGMMKITNVPGMPDYVKGVINLRGKIIPAIDLRQKFGFSEAEYDDRTCIIVVEINNAQENRLTGVIVDRVWEVLDIDKENIEDPPAYGNSIDDDFLYGIGKMDDKVIMLLDSDRIIKKKDLGEIFTEEETMIKNGGKE